MRYVLLAATLVCLSAARTSASNLESMMDAKPHQVVKNSNEQHEVTQTQSSVAAGFRQLLARLQACQPSIPWGSMRGDEWILPSDGGMTGGTYRLSDIYANPEVNFDVPVIEFFCKPGRCKFTEASGSTITQAPRTGWNQYCSNVGPILQGIAKLLPKSTQPNNLTHWRQEGDTIWIYSDNSKQVLCRLDYSVPNGVGGYDEDRRSVVVRAHSRADAGVTTQVANFRIRDCHPWTVNNPQGR